MDKSVYFRRCHICGSLNEMHENQRSGHCETCHKSLAPFQYFDDRFSPIQSDRTLRPPLLEGEFVPIHGLTAYWESF
jgi:hypothetical protein